LSGTELVHAYRNRISELVVIPIQTRTTQSGVAREEYALVMSKNDEMCSHMRQLMNDDLEQYDRTYDSNERFVSYTEEFKAIPWKPARASSEIYGQIHYSDDVEGALFDLNNDGVQDFVVRYKGMLSGMRADGLYMLDRVAASHANSLTFKELFGANNQIALSGGGYDLSAPFVGRTESLWFLSPFIYRGISYVYMQSLYKRDEAIGGDFAVVAKYSGGKFAMREKTGKMDDICYIERVGVKN
jgi:hypothetical protein